MDPRRLSDLVRNKAASDFLLVHHLEHTLLVDAYRRELRKTHPDLSGSRITDKARTAATSQLRSEYSTEWAERLAWWRKELTRDEATQGGSA